MNFIPLLLWATQDSKRHAHAHFSFFLEEMKKDILNFFTECDVLQHNKGEIVKTPGAL